MWRDFDYGAYCGKFCVVYLVPPSLLLQSCIQTRHAMVFACICRAPLRTATPKRTTAPPDLVPQHTVQVTVNQFLLEKQRWQCIAAANVHTAVARAARISHRQLQWIGALGPISVAALSITAVYLGDLQRRAGMAVVGSITAGLPHLTVFWWLPMDHFWQLASTAVVISFVSLLESISIARALAEPRQEGVHPLDPNQELLGGCCPRHL